MYVCDGKRIPKATVDELTLCLKYKTPMKFHFLKLLKSSLHITNHVTRKAEETPRSKWRRLHAEAQLKAEAQPKQPPRSQRAEIDFGQKNWIPVQHTDWEGPNVKQDLCQYLAERPSCTKSTVFACGTWRCTIYKR